MKGGEDMGRYVNVCLNGHWSISGRLLQNEQYCEKCGQKIIDKCPSCGAFIKELGQASIVSVGFQEYELAAYCKKCSKAYPWTQSALEATAKIILAENQLSDSDKKMLIASLPDIIADTPKTELAAMRLKRAAASAGKFTTKALLQFAIDFGGSVALKALGL